MDQEDKLNEYVWFIVSECETFEEFSFKVKLSQKQNATYLISMMIYQRCGMSIGLNII